MKKNIIFSALLIISCGFLSSSKAFAYSSADYYKAGLQLYTAKNYSQAVRYFGAAIQLDPNNTAALQAEAIVIMSSETIPIPYRITKKFKPYHLPTAWPNSFLKFRLKSIQPPPPRHQNQALQTLISLKGLVIFNKGNTRKLSPTFNKPRIKTQVITNPTIT